MDIHRCRFIPYPPPAINAIAVSHPHAPAHAHRHSQAARVAIGRANGNVEIWNPLAGAWHQETVLHGGRNRSVDGLVWVTEADWDYGNGVSMVGRSRLFSIGYTSTVTEWDLEKGRPKSHASGSHGDIWCLAVQPSHSANHGRVNAPDWQHPVPKLVAGTVDGELAIYSIEDGELRFQRVFVKSTAKRTQMVSLTFRSSDVVVVGCSDGAIRAYDLRKGTLLRKMTLGADIASGSKDAIVWSVKCLPNGNIVSGDSTGHVCIWDGKTYTLAQKIQGHKQDVLSLAVSADGSSIMSGGMDRCTVLIRRDAGPEKRWSKVWGRRYHTHDVKAMASVEINHISVVITGGPDASPVLVPLRGLGKENHRTLSSLPQSPPLCSAPRARFIISWWGREVHIWSLRHTFDGLFDKADTGITIDQNRKLLKTIVVKGESNITSATISSDGKLLVVATVTDIKAFSLGHDDPTKASDVKVSQVQIPKDLACNGATKVQLSPDGDWLCVVQSPSRILVAKTRPSVNNNNNNNGDDNDNDHDIQNSTTHTFPYTQKLTLLARNIPKNVRLGGLGNYDRSITHIAFSPDGKIIAAADLSGYIDTWVLRQPREQELHNGTNEDGDADDSSDQASDSESDSELTTSDDRWFRSPRAKLLPRLPAAPVVLSFSNSAAPQYSATTVANGITNGDGITAPDYVLLAMTATWKMFLFHPLQGALAPWSRRNRHLPGQMAQILDLPRGALWHGSRIWFYGASFLCMIDLSQDLPLEHTAKRPQNGEVQNAKRHGTGTKRKRRHGEGGAGGKMSTGNLYPNQIHKQGSGKEKRWQAVVDKSAEGQENGHRVGEMDVDMDADEEDIEGQQGELALRRRQDGEDRPDAGGQTENTGNEGNAGLERRPWWLTYKYRPIFGIVALGETGDAIETTKTSGQQQAGPKLGELEVALVERPTWDIDLPERYFGQGEWER